MHSEAIGSVWTFSKILEIFWIFESFFNVSGRNFYKRLFSRHNKVKVTVKEKIEMRMKMKMKLKMKMVVTTTTVIDDVGNDDDDDDTD